MTAIYHFQSWMSPITGVQNNGCPLFSLICYKLISPSKPIGYKWSHRLLTQPTYCIFHTLRALSGEEILRVMFYRSPHFIKGKLKWSLWDLCVASFYAEIFNFLNKSDEEVYLDFLALCPPHSPVSYSSASFSSSSLTCYLDVKQFLGSFCHTVASIHSMFASWLSFWNITLASILILSSSLVTLCVWLPHWLSCGEMFVKKNSVSSSSDLDFPAAAIAMNDEKEKSRNAAKLFLLCKIIWNQRYIIKDIGLRNIDN